MYVLICIGVWAGSMYFSYVLVCGQTAGMYVCMYSYVLVCEQAAGMYACFFYMYWCVGRQLVCMYVLFVLCMHVQVCLVCKLSAYTYIHTLHT